jgi:hypothetical protein
MIENKLFTSGLVLLALVSTAQAGTFAEQFLTASPAAEQWMERRPAGSRW